MITVQQRQFLFGLVCRCVKKILGIWKKF